MGSPRFITADINEAFDPIAAIAYAAGFADQAHLMRAFKKHTGRTPGRYREAVG